MGEPTVVSRALVEEIWSGVANDELTRVQPSLGEPPSFEALVHDEERRYINARCEPNTTPADVPSAGRLVPIKRRLKGRAAHFVMRVLEHYFADEREFLAHLVRLQNKLTIHHDRLAEELQRLHHALSVESQRLRQQSLILHRQLEQRIETLEEQLAQIQAEQYRPERG